MKYKLVKKPFAIMIIITNFIFLGCSRKVDLRNDESVKNWIHGMSIFLDGELVFNKNGSFKLTPQNQNDPTKIYYGTWTLGIAEKEDIRGLNISFITVGWITDGCVLNGISYSGFGSSISGVIAKQEKDYSFIVERETSAMTWNSDNGGFEAASKKWSRDFKEAKEKPDENEVPPVVKTSAANSESISSVEEHVNTNKETKIIEENKETEVQGDYYVIKDPDGYSNLRDKPNGSVIKKVYEEELFEVLGEEQGYKKVKLEEDGTVGYIHASRVVKYK